MILAALITSLISVGVHIYLALHHYQLKLGLLTGPSACHINSTFNCDSVAVSNFSVFAGIPIAIWGAWTNLALSLLIILSLINLLADRMRVLRYAGLLALYIAVISIVMGLISSIILKTYCLHCMGAYVLSFLSAGALWIAAKPLQATTLSEDLKGLTSSHRWVVMTLLVIPLGSYLTKASFDQNYGLDKFQAIAHESIESWKGAPTVEFDLSQGLSFQSSDKPAVMTIVEFADFLCSHCKLAYPTLHAFAERMDDVKLVFKTFPLDGTCNKEISHKGDGLRCDLAASIYCAEKLSKNGWRLHHWIFDHQDKLPQGDIAKVLAEAASEISLNQEDMKKCIQSDEIRDQIEKIASEGGRAKIPGTPAIFVNGKSLDRGQFMPVLEAIHKEIKDSGN